MKPIPAPLRADLQDDPFYAKCCLTGQNLREWHHNLIHAGSQVNEKWCILPLSPEIHAYAREKAIKELLDWVMLNRGTDEELRRHSKAVDLIRERERLNLKFQGPWTPGKYFKSIKMLQFIYEKRAVENSSL